MTVSTRFFPTLTARRTGHLVLARLASATVALAALLVALPQSLLSQTAQSQTVSPRASHWEVRVASGAMMPTGDQRQVLRSGSLSVAQIAWVPQPSLAVTASFGWAKSRDLGTVGSPKLLAYAADLGVEARPIRWVTGGRMTFSPFIGLGAGSRSYDYRAQQTDATHNLAGYGSVGGELGVGRVGLRVEARSYLSGFKPLTGTGGSYVRGDVFVMAALRFNRHTTARR